jgi:ABC-type sugar transport system substrate-binding protein
MSRRFAGAATIALAALTLAACSSSPGTPAAVGASTGSATKASTSYSMELVVGTKSDDFYRTMECGAEAEASQLGVSLTVTGPADFSPSEQAPILNAVAVSKPDALIVAPTDATALDPELQRIQSSGIKLIFVDTDSSDTSLGLSRITSNNLGGGELAADSLAAQIGDKGTVAVIDVSPGISTTDARIQGFDQEMKAKYPGITVLATQYHRGQRGHR